MTGLVDNFLGRESPWRWRLNDQVAIPAGVHPLRNPGLELTGPWSPLDMAFNALNSPAPMNMPDFEDASPPHFQPDGTPANQPIGIFAAMQNAKDIHEGRWTDQPYEVAKKGKKRSYRIAKPQASWPTRLARPPSIHVRYDHVTVDGKPAPGIVPITVLWTFNNYDPLRRAGDGLGRHHRRRSLRARIVLIPDPPALRHHAAGRGDAELAATRGETLDVHLRLPGLVQRA